MCEDIAHASDSGNDGYESTSSIAPSIMPGAGASTATAPPLRSPPTANTAASTTTVANEAAAVAAATPARKIGWTQLTLWWRGNRTRNYSRSRLRLLPDAYRLKRLRASHEMSCRRRHRRHELDTPSARARSMNEDVPWLSKECSPTLTESTLERLIVVERVTHTRRMPAAAGSVHHDHLSVASIHTPAQHAAASTRAYAVYAHRAKRDAQVVWADPRRRHAFEEALPPSSDEERGAFLVGALPAEFSRNTGDTGALLPPPDVLTRGLLDQRAIDARPYDCVSTPILTTTNRALSDPKSTNAKRTYACVCRCRFLRYSSRKMES